ncbi:4-hydroxy-3-methylbut-2-enyl diphosphate reductase [Youngiibacter multivorans]|uniref:4-hydroxy-3-methylbut-2-enyl diphosphate reductase n=1 Tax=Youngiibacter multivorans TaxID=937251 RepID=A0ABS4G2F1_9CLOT|nr:4-hydroxy-3-methylbut-2-enyl diphosphate reductase [Youngiibacter multivorans]
MREIIRAEYSGFCFGVDRAVKEAFTVRKTKGRTFTLGPLIHNKDVTDKLEDSGVSTISEGEIGRLEKDDTVIIRTHGVTRAVYDGLKAMGVDIIDLTCPYVINIQKKVSEYHDKGYQIVILGDGNHPEVVGINGWCDNSAYITPTGEVDIPLKRKVCVVSQTTEKQRNWLNLIMNIAKTSKEFVAFNTICKATEERQKSAEELSKEVDAMLVIGGKSSSNTKKLYELCRANCEKTYMVENAQELAGMINNFDGAVRVGVTAGASTPEWIIKEAVGLL